MVGPRDGKIIGQEVKYAAMPRIVILIETAKKTYIALITWKSFCDARYQKLNLETFANCQSSLFVIPSFFIIDTPFLGVFI